MRMPPDHLPGDRLDHVAEHKRIPLLRHAGVEHDLQQEITEFVPEIVEIAACDRVRHFIGFLNGVGHNAREILLQIPGAAGLGGAQRRHDLKQP